MLPISIVIKLMNQRASNIYSIAANNFKIDKDLKIQTFGNPNSDSHDVRYYKHNVTLVSLNNR